MKGLQCLFGVSAKLPLGKDLLSHYRRSPGSESGERIEVLVDKIGEFSCGY
jgi:hypothetical protein